MLQKRSIYVAVYASVHKVNNEVKVVAVQLST